MSTRIAVKLGYRTLVVAHQDDLLKNFIKTIYGDPVKGRPPMTNVPKLEKKYGKKICGIVKEMKDLKKYDIACVTYQKFIKENGERKILKYIRGKFTTLIVDEVHQANADAYSKFIGRIDARYKLGLTATDQRKDGRHFIVRDIIGPVVAESKTSAMLPLIKVWETGITPKANYKLWAYAMRFLYKSAERNKMIVKQVFADLRDGHKAIIIPVDTKYHMTELVKMINKQASFNRTHKGEKWPKKTAVEFWRGCPRDEILKNVDEGKIPVLVAIRSMVKQGIDLLTPSAIYINTPMSAEQYPVGAPFFFQLTNRVSTPYDDKPQPIVRLMIDNMGPSLGCLRSLFFGEILPRLKDKDGAQKRYLMADEDRNRIFNIIRANKNYLPIPTPIGKKANAVDQARKEKAREEDARAAARRKARWKPLKEDDL
jgi:superfamily II DNA or RNA helicase